MANYSTSDRCKPKLRRRQMCNMSSYDMDKNACSEAKSKGQLTKFLQGCSDVNPFVCEWDSIPASCKEA